MCSLPCTWFASYVWWPVPKPSSKGYIHSACPRFLWASALPFYFWGNIWEGALLWPIFWGPTAFLGLRATQNPWGGGVHHQTYHTQHCYGLAHLVPCFWGVKAGGLLSFPFRFCLPLVLLGLAPAFPPHFFCFHGFSPIGSSLWLGICSSYRLLQFLLHSSH